jgi:hypothetical protein
VGKFFNIKETLLTFFSLFFLGFQTFRRTQTLECKLKEGEIFFNIKETLLTFFSLFLDFWTFR